MEGNRGREGQKERRGEEGEGERVRAGKLGIRIMAPQLLGLKFSTLTTHHSQIFKHLSQLTEKKAGSDGIYLEDWEFSSPREHFCFEGSSHLTQEHVF